MTYYKTCPGCGANLDPGEICEDCLGFVTFKDLCSAIENLQRGSDFSSEEEIDDLIQVIYSSED